MKHIYFLVVIYILVFSTAINAQRGKSGPLAVSAIVKVNEYTALSTDATAGSTSITVASSSLNTNLRFPANLTEGDLIMIIQMQGATILSGVTDSTWGSITNYNNCGNYELREVLSVPNATTINLTCPLINNYTALGNVQVVRLPRYSTLTVNAGGRITCDPWNGQTGGITAMEVLGATVVNGSINADTLGFRGGQLINMTCCQGVYDFTSTTQEAAQKGEGIAGYQATYTTYGGMYGRGAAANAGGGGDGWNSGGGGGGNGGNIAGYNSNGNPDVSTPSWATAWNLEYAGFASNVSSGGGRGGYTWATCGANPLIRGPGSPFWSADDRRNVGGKGGRPLDYSTGRLFLGGGGGAGHEDNNSGSGGAPGGGLVYIVTYRTVTGTGQISANGAAAQTSTQSTPSDDNDAPGGGGAGGTVIVNAINTISGVTTLANGGAGGNQAVGTNPANECEGPGGGGGHIALSNTGVIISVLGGANGTTNATCVSTFIPNGGTKGGVGDTGSVTNFIIVSHNDSICKNNTATLTATLSGTVPAGTTIEWYDSLTGGTLLGSGASFTTSVLTTTTIYYVGPCPGDYRQADTVFVVNGIHPTISLLPDSICRGDSSTLTVSGGNSYLWSNGASTSIINVSPLTTTTYRATVFGICDSVVTTKVTVIQPPVPIIKGTTTKCKGIKDTLYASGGGTYVWSNGSTTTSYFTGTINADSSVTLKVTNAFGCSHDTTFSIAITPPTVTNGLPAIACKGSSIVLISNIAGAGPFTYKWSPGGQTGDTISVIDSTNKIYTVTATPIIGCSSEEIIPVIPDIPVLSACCNTVILKGTDTILVANGANIKTYKWSPTNSLNCDTCSTITATPTVTTTYTVVGTDSLGCQTERIITIIVEAPCMNFTVPNVFTPTYAGPYAENNLFYIKTLNLSSWSILIYDRWGKEMFNTSNPTQYWDGNTPGGGNAPAGVYYYIINATCQGNTYKKDGYLQLIR